MTGLKQHIVPHDTALPPNPPGVRYVRLRAVRVIIIADDRLRRRVDRYFHWPMIVLALMVIPLLLLELLVFRNLERWTLEWWAIMSAVSIIWLAFFVEFIVKIAIAECRVEYVRRNWLDVIILVMPVLRPLRLGSAAARTTRVFTLRGVGMKMARYVFTLLIGLEATDRLLRRVGLRSDDRWPEPRTMTRHQLMDEVKRLRRHTAAWEQWYEDHLSFHRDEGHPVYTQLKPRRNAAPRPEPEPELPLPHALDAPAPGPKAGPATAG